MKKLNKELFQSLASDLGLNLDKFNRDMKSLNARKKLEEDIRDAKKAGVRGTPSVFINGVALKQRSSAGFQKLIDRMYSRAKSKK